MSTRNLESFKLLYQMVCYIATNDVTAEEEQVKFKKVIRLFSSYDIGTVHKWIYALQL
jgi:hypothetical protein